ncbi:MAG: hypothetical protein VW405_00265 [Rhodospirillaceae bacterium]
MFTELLTGERRNRIRGLSDACEEIGAQLAQHAHVAERSGMDLDAALKGWLSRHLRRGALAGARYMDIEEGDPDRRRSA